MFLVGVPKSNMNDRHMRMRRAETAKIARGRARSTKRITDGTER
jgi:hypothetical protein